MNNVFSKYTYVTDRTQPLVSVRSPDGFDFHLAAQ